MAKDHWRAACIQMPSRLAALAPDVATARLVIADNVGVACRAIEATLATDTPPDLVVLPEFALQGPPHGGTIADWIERACDTVPGSITAPLQALAARRGIYIAGNQFETDPLWPGRFFNSCFLIDRHGEVILRFRRINTASWPSPHDFMDDYVQKLGPEGTFPVVETELGRLAMIACGEIAVPEVARVLMMRGAEVILHPTNEDYSPAQEAAKIARAAENMVYLISANVAGGIGFSANGSVLGGRSRIVDFRGRTLVHEAGTDPATISAEIDMTALRAARSDMGMSNVLLRGRYEMYKPYYEAARFYPPNGFLREPMRDARDASSLAEQALANLRDATIAPA